MPIEVADEVPATPEEDEAFRRLEMETSTVPPAAVELPRIEIQPRLQRPQAPASHSMLLLTVRRVQRSDQVPGADWSETIGMVSRFSLPETIRQLAAYEDAYSAAHAPNQREHHIIGVTAVGGLLAGEIALARLVDVQALLAEVGAVR